MKVSNNCNCIQRVFISYTNYKGVLHSYLIEPLEIYWGSSSYHPAEQMLLEAFVYEKDGEPLLRRELRVFAIKDITQWFGDE